jgi:hypothetical protein
MEVNVGPLKEGNMLRIFERRIFRMIYGPLISNGIWRIRYHSELCMIEDEQDRVKVIKIGRLR